MPLVSEKTSCRELGFREWDLAEAHSPRRTLLGSSVNKGNSALSSIGTNTVRHKTRKLLYVVAFCTCVLDSFVVCTRCRSGIRACRNLMERQTQQRPGEEMQEEPGQKTQRGKLWEWTGFGDKTAWDWMQLLIIPVVLAVGALWFNYAQQVQQRETEQSRAAAQLQVQEQSAQEEALRAYLEDMESLILNKGLLSSQKGDEVRTIAQARTLAVLRRIAPDRKREVMQFLSEAGLVSRALANNAEPIVNLDEADWSGGDLSRIDLPQAHLVGANLSGANLKYSNWDKVFMEHADLSGAYLYGSGLEGARMTGVDLSDADLSNTDLSNADLSNAGLSGTNLQEADLSGADLQGAQGVTNEELEEQAKALEDTTMPDGSTHG